MSQVRVALVGVGNCAAALVQGVTFYRDATDETFIPGLMHPRVGPYAISDIVFSAAFDVNAEKVGKDLSEAIFAPPNNTIRFADVPTLGVTVSQGPALDGIGPSAQQFVPVRDGDPDDVVQILQESQTDIVVNFLPVGSGEATAFYARAALEAGCGFVNCMPIFIASDETWASRFAQAGLPIIGDDVKSQVGATIVHRALTRLFKIRGVRLDRTYQLNFGGNLDFANMLDRDRLSTKRISKTRAVTSQIDYDLPPEAIHIDMDEDLF